VIKVIQKGGFFTKEPKKILAACMTFVISVVILQLSSISNSIPVVASLIILFGIGIGVFMCIAFDVARKRAMVIVTSSLGVFGLVILYAQYSRGLLF